MGLSFYCLSCSFWFTRFCCVFKTGFGYLLVLHITQCCSYFIFLWNFVFLHHLVWQRIVSTFLTFLVPQWCYYYHWHCHCCFCCHSCSRKNYNFCKNTNRNMQVLKTTAFHTFHNRILPIIVFELIQQRTKTKMKKGRKKKLA